MTYCVGFKHGKSVYLFSDSAVTRFETSATKSESSFGETFHPTPGLSVSEGALKIIRVSEDCLVAIAGDAKRAIDAALSLRTAFESGSTVKEALQSLSNSIESRKDEEFSMLVARSGTLCPELWKWSSAQGSEATEISSGCVASIGNLTSWHDSFAKNFLGQLSRSPQPEESVLSMAGAFLQALSSRDILFQGGVGGAFAGAKVGPNGVSWMPDTTYVLHDKAFQSVNLISVCARGDGIAVNSSYTNDTRCMLVGVSEDEAQGWFYEWEIEVRSIFEDVLSSVWVFIQIEPASILLVHSPLNIRETNFFKVEPLGDGKFDFAYQEVLKVFQSLVVSKPPLGQEEGLPFRFSCVSAATGLEHLCQELKKAGVRFAQS